MNKKNKTIMTGEQPFLIFDNVHFDYGKKTKGLFQINSLNLSIKKEQCTFLLGKNGSGKTTISKLMTGLLKPIKGEVFLEQKNTKELPLGEIGQRIGYLWQKPEIQLFAPTVLEELTFVGTLKKQDQEENYRQAIYWLSYFNLEHLKNRSPFFLSKGEKQRLALAATISNGAKYLILDEPTTGLDRKRKESFISLLKKLNEEDEIGMTIISHDEYFIKAFEQKRVIWLEEGEIKSDEGT